MSELVANTSGALNVNQAWWDERAALHAQSEFYDIDSIIRGEIRLRDYERAEVGDVAGKTLVHLQCHLGTETIGWARLGAQSIGVDFAPDVVRTARELAKRSGVDIRYEVGDVYDSTKILGEEVADVVYINTGSLHYLPDIDRWGETVHDLLKPGGLLYVNEIHPISNVLDEVGDRATFLRDYFNEGPVVWDEDGSYADTQEPTTHNQHVVWDRPLSSIVSAVLGAELQLTSLRERPGQEFQQFGFQVRDFDGLWQSPAGHGAHPSTYSLSAIKPVVA